MPATCIHDQTRGHCPVCRMDALEAHFGVPADHDDLNGADGDRDADRDADRDLRTDGGSNNGAPGHHLGGPYECARCGEEFVNLANVLKCCGEELGERTDSNDPRLRTDGGVDTVLACPECDRAAVNTRGRGRNSLDDGEAKYRCSACRAYFDDPVERPSRDTGGAGRKGLSKRLADMDADDLRADGGVDTDQTVPACPDCGAAHVRVFGRRGSAGNRSVDADAANYRCDACGAHFDDYDERPSLNTTSTRHGLSKRLGDMDADDLRADGSGHECDACGETFATLTRLRLHEKDDCRARETYARIDPKGDGEDVGGQTADELVVCRDCGQPNPDANFDYTTGYDGEDFHYIVEFDCAYCGFENENRAVMTGVDEADLDDLPPHLQPEDDTLATDGGAEREQCLVCAHPYARDEHDECPNCGNTSLDEFATDGGYVDDDEPRYRCDRCGEGYRLMSEVLACCGDEIESDGEARDDRLRSDGGVGPDGDGHGDGERFPNPYRAATILPPGRRHLEAVSQFLEEERHRLSHRLFEIEHDDGSIPDEASDEWSMAKGKLDQTRLFHGLVIQSMLADEMKQEDDRDAE